MGSASATGEGEVDTVLTVPAATPAGEWDVYARGPDGGAVSSHLTVAGPPVEAGEACDPLEPGEICPTELPRGSATSPGRRSAAPSGATAAAAAPAATFHLRTLLLLPQDLPAPVPAPSQQTSLLWFVAAAGGLVTVVLVLVVSRLRRSGPPGHRDV